MSTANGSQLIDALCRPGVLGAPGARVELLETHISWVLLVGDLAYKLKKPLNLGFLDFSTLEKRRQACLDELRLNRRLAPELYLEVVSLTGTPRSPSVGGNGEILEYAVKMRRFSQSQLMSERLRTRRLTPELIDTIAEAVGHFHFSQPAADPHSPWGKPDLVWEPVKQNFRHIESTPLAHHYESELLQLFSWSKREFQTKISNFEKRREAGFIRECHGDMHLGNMIADNGGVTIFDCLEFNASLRWIDTCSEVAFLVMDLTDRGAQHYAFRVLNRYLEMTADFGALSVLRFYLVYRAMVRAKVHAIRCQQAQAEPEEYASALSEAAGYLNLATRYTTLTTPAIVITFGLSGSGKTTYTQMLLERIGAIRVRSDVERKRLAGIATHGTSDSALNAGIYSPSATQSTYAHLLELGREIVASGWPVIVDATFLRADQRKPFWELAKKWKLPFVILDCQASTEKLEQRVIARAHAGSDASEATIDVLHRQLEQRQPLSAQELEHVYTLDTDAISLAGNWIEDLLQRLETTVRPD